MELLDADLNEKEEIIKSKKIKEELRKNKLKKEQEELEKDKKFFNNYFIQKEIELNEREKQLSIKEEKLNRKIEFYIPPKELPILIGLNNIGTICYMNASLQCFSNTKK